MKTLSIEEYKEIKLKELQYLESKATSWSELRFVLSNSWFDRVRAVINKWDKQLDIDDGAYDLFRIFMDDLGPEILNERLIKVETVAREQNRLRAYRKSRGELASVQTNQILGSIFEINIVYAALQACCFVEVFPKVGNGGSDVEAKLMVGNRQIFIEAKALTHSKHDISAPYSGYVGTHSIDSMIKQIHDALNEKLTQGKQLQLISEDYPTVLFMALGRNADDISGPWGIESFLQTQQSNVSAIVLLGSPFCRTMPKIFKNDSSTFLLSKKECAFFENSFCGLKENKNT